MMLKEFIAQNNATLLCSGPMSKNCIDAAIEISKKFNVPQVLIASRRQIDAAEFGGGYVEGFNTPEFSSYVRGLSAEKVFLARDHGGPWQSTTEVSLNLSVEQAMESAKRSFESDISSDFDYIHIDPSVPIGDETLTLDTILSRLFELYGHCSEFALSQGKNIEFELGTEEQDGYAQDLQQFEYFLQETKSFCEKNRIAAPSFVVAQTGTRVMETQNVGTFDTDLQLKTKLSMEHIKKTLNICEKYNIMLKEHNTDYLSDEALRMRPVIGVHASNVAPEFGVAETKALFYVLKKFGFQDEYEKFVGIALASNKWQKWMLPNSKKSDVDKAIICGHYVFNHQDIVEMKVSVAEQLLKKNIVLDTFLKDIVKQTMLRYAHLFNMI